MKYRSPTGARQKIEKLVRPQSGLDGGMDSGFVQ